jgi:hypothetical protein
MWKSEEGSTQRLIQLCAGYFAFYVVTGVSVKYFLGPLSKGFPGMTDMDYLVYSTIASSALCIGVVIVKGWFRVQSNQSRTLLGVSFPSELLYIIPSGICTAIVVPTTTLMYSLKGVSVMVAMVIMRGAVIAISRVVDAIQIRQEILDRKVYSEENWAVVFALSAVCVNVFSPAKTGERPFYESVPALVILSFYVAAYSFRIFIMNYYKNTRPKNAPYDNTGFFGTEQLSASFTMLILGIIAYNASSWFGVHAEPLTAFGAAFTNPKPGWGLALFSGLAYGFVAFLSVFIFMFKGRSATFAGLVNRLTSLVAGTTATIISALVFGGSLPKLLDWISLSLILVAVYFLSRAEKRRSAESAKRAAPVADLVEESPAVAPQTARIV